MTDLHVAGDGPTGVLVLAGSSGRVEEERCRVLGALGATAASYRWFGDAVDRVPLESFDDALAALHERCDRLVVLGTSSGAEAACCSEPMHPEIDAVVAVSAPDVVWAALSTGPAAAIVLDPRREPLSFVPYDDGWEPETDPVEFVGMYEQSLETYADRVPAARIPSSRSLARCCWSPAVTTGSGRPATWPSTSSRAGSFRPAHHPVSHPGRPPRRTPGEQPALPRTWCTAAPRGRRRSGRLSGRTCGRLTGPGISGERPAGGAVSQQPRTAQTCREVPATAARARNGGAVSHNPGRPETGAGATAAALRSGPRVCRRPRCRAQPPSGCRPLRLGVAGSRHTAGRSNQRRCSKSALTRSPTPSSQTTSGSEANISTASAR